MSRRNPQKIVVVAITCLVFSCMISPPAFAAEPHENPETAGEVFSGVALFQYYSNSLDFVMMRYPAEVEGRLGETPFAYIPPDLKGEAVNFAANSIRLSNLAVEIDTDVNKIIALIDQYRFDEASRLAIETYGKLLLANSGLGQIEDAVETIGDKLKVPLSPENSSLRRSYNEVLAKIEKLKKMPDLYEEILANLLKERKPSGELIEKVAESIKKAELKIRAIDDYGIDVGILVQLLEEEGITIDLLKPSDMESLKHTDVTLEIEPLTSFVGGNIDFQGSLTSDGEPLAGRAVDILLNGFRYLTVTSEADGYFQGTLQVPYWYIPTIDLRALYYPKNQDIGVYMSSVSSLVKLGVSFYRTGLEVMTEDEAYPGLETTVTGKFHYYQSPIPEERRIEIYLDDVLIDELWTGEEFSLEIGLDPELEIGTHIIAVSAVESGRYSPVTCSTILNVTKITPILDINKPAVAILPGTIRLEGKVYSEAGPLSWALLRIGLGTSEVELVSSPDGTFETEIKKGTGFGLIGSQNMRIQIIPQEPWHATLTTSESIVTANVITAGGTFILLVLLGIFLPGRLRSSFKARSQSRIRPAEEADLEATPVYSYSSVVNASPDDRSEADRRLRHRIFNIYSLVIGLIQRITDAMLKPQLTLREFTVETSRALGPTSKYLVELTRIVERLLYSRYGVTEDDVEKSQQLSNKIEEELRGEGI